MRQRSIGGHLPTSRDVGQEWDVTVYYHRMKAEVVLTVAPDVTTMTVGDEISAFHSGTGRALSLNRTAAAVYAEVDGHSRVHDIVNRLAASYALPVEAIEGDVLDALTALVAAGMLLERPAHPSTPNS